MKRLAAIAVLGLASCGPPSAKDCIKDHPAGPEFEVVNYWKPGQVPPLICPDTPGQPSPCDAPWPDGLPKPQTAVEELLYECAASGNVCDSHGWISEGAARCIASAAGLKDGLRGLSADLVYNQDLGPIWAVSNRLVDNGSEGSSGDVMSVDAASGRVVENGTWDEIP